MSYNALIETLLNAYKRKGRIGRVRPYDLEHAKKVAHMVATRILKQNI